LDRISKDVRSNLMRAVRTKNTSPEVKVRSVLHRLGYRFRLHRRDLPGSPDIVLPRRRVVVFVHGCFWHSHSCKHGSPPASNIAFWKSKMRQNKERDRRNKRKLQELGWHVITIWECEIKNHELLRVKLAEQLESSSISH
jgi:DNA mismatch endonuclease (patch repair protein)